MEELRNRAWADLSQELDLPADARSDIEKTGLFQRHVAYLALKDFGNAVLTALPRPIARLLHF